MKRLSPSKTALLTLDLQAGILQMAQPAPSLIPAAATAVRAARTAGIPVFHVALGFEQNHPEIPSTLPESHPFLKAKQMGSFIKGSEQVRIHPDLYQEDETVFYKQRAGAFSHNNLDAVLRGLGINCLVLAGISTSGVVLSTIRRAFDLDYRLVVLEDACFDGDEEVQEVLMGKVLTKQADVVKVGEFVEGLS